MDAAEEHGLRERLRTGRSRVRKCRTVQTRSSSIASGSKAFTALAIMQLVEDGALEPRPARARELLAQVSRDRRCRHDEHLLTHTSGIGDYLDEETEGAIRLVLAAPVHTLDDGRGLPAARRRVSSRASPPGERWAYSNGNYVVLAIILERVPVVFAPTSCGASCSPPRGLGSTDFLRLDELPGTAALGYLFDDGNPVNTLNLPVLGNGDGGAFTTAADLHRFWRALFAGEIVSPATVAEWSGHAPRSR